MTTIQLHSHVGPDGVLKIEVPLGMKDADLDVVLIVNQLHEKEKPDSGKWPPGFFPETFGSFCSDPLIRDPQGDFETREDHE